MCCGVREILQSCSTNFYNICLVQLACTLVIIHSALVSWKGVYNEIPTHKIQKYGNSKCIIQTRSKPDRTEASRTMCPDKKSRRTLVFKDTTRRVFFHTNVCFKTIAQLSTTHTGIECEQALILSFVTVLASLSRVL